MVGLTGCPSTACPGAPLEAPDEAPAWVVGFFEAPAPVDPAPRFPSMDPVMDPPGVGQYAVFALYGPDGEVLNERWLDTFTTWTGATGSIDAASRLPASQPPGRLIATSSNGLRGAVSFDLSTGEVGAEVRALPYVPDAGGQWIDLARLGDGTALASRARASGGAQPALVHLDLGGEEGTALSMTDVASLSSGRVEPGGVAALAGVDGRAELAVVGLSLPGEPDAGAVTIVEPGGLVYRLDLGGLSRCGDAVALPADPERPAVGRAVVMCTGDPTLPARERVGAGFALIEADEAGVRAEPPRLAREAFAEHPPTGGLVALSGSWVAYVSTTRSGIPTRDGESGGASAIDTLVALDIASGSGELLWQESWSDAFGAALGEGAFSEGSSELWWPSVEAGLLRWEVSGEGASARFEPRTAAPPLGCVRAPARIVRHLPSAADP